MQQDFIDQAALFIADTTQATTQAITQGTTQATTQTPKVTTSTASSTTDITNRADRKARDASDKLTAKSAGSHKKVLVTLPAKRLSAGHIPDSLRAVINRRDTWLGRADKLSGDFVLDMDSTDKHAHAANGTHHSHYHRRLPTGFGALDARLCEQGWPLGATIEVLSDASGMGAMGLFLPAMETLSQQQRWQAFIAPPYTPYAPLLAARGIDTQQVLLVHPKSREERLWSAEQALRSGTCSAVFCWLGDEEYKYAELRRLQLAAAQGNTLAVLFRSQDMVHQHAPASLRLQMTAYREVHIVKQRSGIQGVNVYLPPEDDIPHQPQLWELPASSELSLQHRAC